MRVLLVTGAFPPYVAGGAELSALNLAVGLRELGHEVSVLTAGPRDECSRVRGVGVLYVGAPGVGGAASLMLNPYALAYRMSKKLRALVRAPGFDVVHSNTVMNLGFPSAGLPSVLTLVSLSVLCPVGNYLCINRSNLRVRCGPLRTVRCMHRFLGERRRLSLKGKAGFAPYSLFAYLTSKERARALRNFDAFVAISDYVRDALLESTSVPAKRVSVIPPAVDEEAFEREPEPQERDGNTVLFVGRLEPEKGIRTLLRSIRMVLRSIPDCRFVIVGGGTLKEEVTSFTRGEGVGDRVSVEGEVPYERLPRYYKLSDVVVVPSSWQEPFGMVVADAMLSRRPVVGTSVGGLPELVRHGESGLLVEPNDPAALAEAVVSILQNPAVAREMGERGYEMARGRFSKRVVAERMVEVYERIAGGGAGATAAVRVSFPASG